MKKTPGLNVNNTLRRTDLRVVTGRDDSVYSKENIGSAAWRLQENEQENMMACFLMQHVSSTMSYRE